MASYELNKKLTVAQENGLIFIQVNKLRKKIYSDLSNVNLHYYLKLRKPIMHRRFLRKLSQNKQYVEQFCNVRNNPFHFACRKWYLYSNPQSFLVFVQVYHL